MDSLPPAVLALGALVIALPLMFLLQRVWVQVLWARRLGRARAKAEGDPADAGAHYELGVLCALRGEDAGAREAFERARAAKPGHAAATVGLGHLAADGGDLDGALVLFEEASVNDPGLFSAWFGIASVQMQREQYARAAQAYGRAIEAAPGDGFALAGLARCLFELGDHARAAEYAVQAAQHGVTDDDLARDLRDAQEE